MWLFIFIKMIGTSYENSVNFGLGYEVEKKHSILKKYWDYIKICHFIMRMEY